MCKTCNNFCQQSKSECIGGCALISSITALEAQVAQLTEAIKQLGTLSPTAQYTEQLGTLSPTAQYTEQLGTLSPTAQYTEQSKQDRIGVADESKSEVATTISEESAKSSNEKTKADEAISEMLFNQLKSKEPDDLLQVAKCPMAKAEHLLEVAKLCAEIYHHSDDFPFSDPPKICLWIASAIAQHPLVNGEAIIELSKSMYYAVWRIAAKCPGNSESTLNHIAEQCVKAEYSFRTEMDNVVTELAYHPNRTTKTLAILASSPFSSARKIAHEAMHELTGIEEAK